MFSWDLSVLKFSSEMEYVHTWELPSIAFFFRLLKDFKCRIIILHSFFFTFDVIHKRYASVPEKNNNYSSD